MASILLFRSVRPPRGILRSRRRRLLGFLLPLARFGKERLLVPARREKLSSKAVPVVVAVVVFVVAVLPQNVVAVAIHLSEKDGGV